MISDKTCHIRVLHIASGDLWAGAEAQLFILAKALKNNTNTIVDIVLLNHGILEKKLLNSGFNVSVLDESNTNSIIILWRLIRIIYRIRPDVIHTHRIKENILGCLATFLTSNIPILRTSHGAPEHTPSRKQLSKRIIKWIDIICGRYLQRAIIAVSEDLAEKLKKNFPAKKILTIENGIDLQDIKGHFINKIPANPGETLKIGFAGRLVAVKRVDILIKTARLILDNYPELTIAFHIYGDGPLKQELVQLNRRLNTDKIVIFEGHCDDILEQIQKMDALLVTSDHEGLPMIVLEAMALGTPVIAHAVGGIPQVLDYGRCGFLISENSPSQYAEAIKQLADNPVKKSKIIQLATQRIEERYTATANAQAYYLLYKSLLQ